MSAASQLSEYFSGSRTSFDLPLQLNGTAFQKAVWEALLTIPLGETKSCRGHCSADRKSESGKSSGNGEQPQSCCSYRAVPQSYRF